MTYEEMCFVSLELMRKIIFAYSTYTLEHYSEVVKKETKRKADEDYHMVYIEELEKIAQYGIDCCRFANDILDAVEKQMISEKKEKEDLAE